MSSTSLNRARLDCSRLLHLVADHEANESSFGHPESPKVHLFRVSYNILLAVAFTSHVCYVQEHRLDDTKEAHPRQVCHMEEEQITCLQVVSLEEEDLLRQLYDDRSNHPDSDEEVSEFSVKVDEREKDSPKKGPKQTLVTGRVSRSIDDERRISIVIGTNQSRVYAVELIVDLETGRIHENTPLILCEVLPHDVAGQHRSKTPFTPTGAVVSFTRAPNALSVYFGNGCLLRMDVACFFPSVWQLGAETGQTVDQILGRQALIRCQIRLPGKNYYQGLVVPLPRHHSSPVSGLDRKLWLGPDMSVSCDEGMASATTTLSEEDDEDVSREPRENFEALVFGASSDSPTLTFYTSEFQFAGKERRNSNLEKLRAESGVLGGVVGGTKAIVGGVLGTTLGALRWSFGGGSHSPGTPVEVESSFNESMEVDEGFGPFPTLWSTPIGLYPGEELHDGPRQIDFCTVSPDGQLAAVADNLGRILLIDLVSKQVIRMWKGYREATCSWLQSNRSHDEKGRGNKNPHLNLAIHSKQRRVVEVWRVRLGDRLSSVQVDRRAELLPVAGDTGTALLATTYLLLCSTPGNALNYMEEIQNDSCSPIMSSFVHDKTNLKLHTMPSTRSAALRLQHLRQLLSATSVQFTSQDVYQALRDITSLADLSESLDLLARSSLLEEKLSIDGASFQKMAVAYCTETLDAAVKGEKSALTNANVVALQLKIDYYSSVIKAYEIISKVVPRQSSDEPRPSRCKNLGNWTAEAMGWVTVYENVMKTSLDAIIQRNACSRLRFSQFASACVFPPSNVEGRSRRAVYFSDSSRTRREILFYIFQPFLADVFSFNLVFSIFDALGIRHDYLYLSKLFGEWFLSLPINDIYQKGLSSGRPPLIRFLQEMAAEHLEGNLGDVDIVLSHIHTLCERAEDLPRAFLLAALCRDATERASLKKEKQTYGKVVCSRLTSNWESLLRRLRVCLLVSLRLKNMRLAAPITVQNMGEGIFSMYELLARDELAMSHNQNEIVSLENACKVSTLAFDPSTADGDESNRVRLVQNSCLTSSIGEEERAEYLIDFDDEDKFGALVLFFRDYNDPNLLAAHRVKLLGTSWLGNLSDLGTLQSAVAALSALCESQRVEQLSLAVGLDLWYSCICPIYRAYLFGSDDAHEVNEEIVVPLLDDKGWLSAFGKVSLQILAMLRKVPWIERPDNIVDILTTKECKSETFPPLMIDGALRSLVDRIRVIDDTALDAHCAVVCALLVSQNIELLAQCVPSIYVCFLPSALYEKVAEPSDVQSLRMTFLKDAVVMKVKKCEGPEMSVFDLNEIETLGRIWGFEGSKIRTMFLLGMYELGKDALVDDMLMKNSKSLEIRKFVESGVDIVCRRLHSFLNGKDMQKPEMRETMGILDADLCEWINRRAEKSSPLIPSSVAEGVDISQTHIFSLHLLSLSASSNVETTLRVKIHSLVVLSGTIVKVLEYKGT